MWAAGNGRSEVAEIPAKNGVDLKKKDKKGQRADDMAEQNGHKDLAKMLRRRIGA